ncbi:MAG: phage holin family protein [Lautropia sp.]
MPTDTNTPFGATPGSTPGPDATVRPQTTGGGTYASGAERHAADPFAQDERLGSQPGTPPVTGLFRNLVDDLGRLVSMEVRLARAEVGQSVARLKGGVASVAAGGAVLFAGCLVLLGAAVLIVAQFVALWIAALIVGVVVALIGLVMLQAGRKRFEANAFVPERTIDSLQKDQDMIRRKL